MSGNNQLNNEQVISLKELILKLKAIIQYLISKKIIIICIALLGGLIGVLYSFYKKTIYTAELSFAVDDDKSNGGLVAAAGIASQFGIDLGGGGGAFSGDNLMRLMKSRTMVEKTLMLPVNVNGRAISLADLYISFNNFKSRLKNVQFPLNTSPEYCNFD